MGQPHGPPRGRLRAAELTALHPPAIGGPAPAHAHARVAAGARDWGTKPELVDRCLCPTVSRGTEKGI